MVGRGEPSWWYGEGPRWQTGLLAPVGFLVGKLAAARLRRPNPYRSKLPVLCVGNFTAGGTGKTPLALLIADLVSEQNREPWFLSRGYGGRLRGPHSVEPLHDSAKDVGDEPLLLVRHAPTVISRDRRLGALAIEAAAPGNAVIIMDDGLQNPALVKDLTIAVVDAGRGFGNGRVIPAGPLRAPLEAQIGLADVIVLTGRQRSGEAALVKSLRLLTSAPIIAAETRAAQSAEQFRGRRIIAYAGIANPQRFFSLLESLGAKIVETRVFADHYALSDADARSLLETARAQGADLATTEKDYVRLSRLRGPSAELKERSSILAIKSAIEGDDLATLTGLIRKAVGGVP